MNTIQCPNCGHRFRLLKSDYQAIVTALQEIYRNNGAITTSIAAARIGYSEYGMRKVLNKLRCAGVIDRYGERGTWFFPDVVAS